MIEHAGAEWTNEKDLLAKESKTFSLHLHKNSCPGVKVFSEREGCCARAGVCHPQWKSQWGGRPIYSGTRLYHDALFILRVEGSFGLVR